MNPAWGALMNDYITTEKGDCNKCRLVHYKYEQHCWVDCVIKNNYNRGNSQGAIALLRDMPTEELKDYLDENRRTPNELKAFILDELKSRREYEKPKEVMRL